MAAATSMMYVLDGHEPRQVHDPNEWARWFGKFDNRLVRRDERTNVQAYGVTIIVTTVFVGLDLDLGDVDPPLLFETCIRGGLRDMEIHRWATWDEAEEEHARIVASIRFPEDFADEEASTRP